MLSAQRSAPAIGTPKFNVTLLGYLEPLQQPAQINEIFIVVPDRDYVSACFVGVNIKFR